MAGARRLASATRLLKAGGKAPALPCTCGSDYVMAPPVPAGRRQRSRRADRNIAGVQGCLWLGRAVLQRAQGRPHARTPRLRRETEPTTRAVQASDCLESAVRATVCGRNACSPLPLSVGAAAANAEANGEVSVVQRLWRGLTTYGARCRQRQCPWRAWGAPKVRCFTKHQQVLHEASPFCMHFGCLKRSTNCDM